MLRDKSSKAAERPSLLISLKLVRRNNGVLDEEEAWSALIDCFKNHPHLAVYQAAVSPDKEGTAVEQ